MTWWQYLLLANVYLMLFYGFYALLLRRETFFQLNRIYLISASVLSFLIPLIQAEWLRNLFITKQLNQTIYRLDAIDIYVTAPQQQNGTATIGDIVAWAYVAGIAFLLAKLVFNILAVRLEAGKAHNDGAWSFFKVIRIGKDVADADIILAHEEVHAIQWHSLDILLIELVLAFSWFNPVIYLYRRALKYTHEFIADSSAVKASAGKHAYAMLLLSQTFDTPAHNLVNPFFNHSLLKQRIVMLQKNKSQRVALLKYGLSAPLFALMLVLSSATTKTAHAITDINNKATELMLIQAKDVVTVTDLPLKKAVEEKLELPVREFKPAIQKDPVFTSVKQSATFPGGISAFSQFLVKNIRMTPAITQQNPGRVIVTFVVERDGRLTNLNVLRGEGPAALEAVRVLSLSPKWIPGMQNGKKIRQQYTVPIKFSTEKLVGQADAPPPPPPATEEKEVVFNGNKTLTGSAFTFGNGKINKNGVVKVITIRRDSSNILHEPNTDVAYYVNNVKVMLDTLKYIDPKNIERIDVVKKKASEGVKAENQIYINTKNK